MFNNTPSIQITFVPTIFVHIDKPGPPAAFDISEITSESCLLSWNPPRDDGGSKITNYIVERRAVDSEIWYKLSSTVKQTTYKATKLVAFKEYVFRVYAENQFGVGAPAEHAPIIARYPFGMLFLLCNFNNTMYWCLQCPNIFKINIHVQYFRYPWTTIQTRDI